MKPEYRVLLALGRECIRAREELLKLPPLHPDVEERVKFSQQNDRVFALWDCYKMVYTRLFGAWPRWQLRFY